MLRRALSKQSFDLLYRNKVSIYFVETEFRRTFVRLFLFNQNYSSMHTDYYRRKLPHWQPAGATFFVTFRLAGSIPLEKLREFEYLHAFKRHQIQQNRSLDPEMVAAHLTAEHKRHFARVDDWMDKNLNAPHFLGIPEVATLVAATIREKEGEWYIVNACCIMPNHVHLLLTLHESAPPLTKVMQRIKGVSGYHANKLLQRKGQFWERESYDHVVRNESSFARIVAYIRNNPVKAGFVKRWEDWPWTF